MTDVGILAVPNQVTVTVAADSGFPATQAVLLIASVTVDLMIEPVGDERRTLIVRQNGDVVAELADASHGDITLGINATIDTADVTFPPGGATEALIRADELQELQLWRGDQVLLWGPITKPQIGVTKAAVSVSGVPWYLTRRVIGTPGHTNLTINSDLSLGMAGYVFGLDVLWAGLQAKPIPLAAVVTDAPGLPGKRALKATYTPPSPDDPHPVCWVAQDSIMHTVPYGRVQGVDWSVSAWVYIPSATVLDPSGQDSILTIVRESTTELSADPAVLALDPTARLVLDVQATPVDDKTPRDRWFRVDAALTQPLTDGVPDWLRFQLNMLRGDVYFRNVTLGYEVTLDFVGVVQNGVIADLVAHGQDPSFGKSDCRIAVDAPFSPTDVVRFRSYNFDDHKSVWDAVTEFTTLGDGVDIKAYYSRFLRGIRARPTNKLGRRVTYTRLVVGPNVSDVAWVWDGETATSTEIFEGEGTGPSRDEAVAFGETFGPDHVVLETVTQAPAETQLDSLTSQAASELARGQRPDVLDNVMVPASAGLTGRLGQGDLIMVDWAPWPSVSWRIVALVIHANDSMTLTLNVETS